MVFVTSRESLAIDDAWFHPVSGLDYHESPDADAVRLFAQMAQRNQPEFDLQQQLPAVLRICRMVEGMPLAALEDGLEREIDVNGEHSFSANVREGLAAFHEKREPKFT